MPDADPATAGAPRRGRVGADAETHLIGQRILAAAPALRRIGRSCARHWSVGGAGYRTASRGLRFRSRRASSACAMLFGDDLDRPYRRSLRARLDPRGLERSAGSQFDTDVVVNHTGRSRRAQRRRCSGPVAAPARRMTGRTWAGHGSIANLKRWGAPLSVWSIPLEPGVTRDREEPRRRPTS